MVSDEPNRVTASDDFQRVRPARTGSYSTIGLLAGHAELAVGVWPGAEREGLFVTVKGDELYYLVEIPTDHITELSHVGIDLSGQQGRAELKQRQQEQKRFGNGPDDREQQHEKRSLPGLRGLDIALYLLVHRFFRLVSGITGLALMRAGGPFGPPLCNGVSPGWRSMPEAGAAVQIRRYWALAFPLPVAVFRRSDLRYDRVTITTINLRGQGVALLPVIHQFADLWQLPWLGL